MKKFTFAVSAATVLAAATIGLAAPASASPSGFAPQDDPCTVHVLHEGSLVDVKWC